VNATNKCTLTLTGNSIYATEAGSIWWNRSRRIASTLQAYRFDAHSSTLHV
jgi:hypothetical protein